MPDIETSDAELIRLAAEKVMGVRFPPAHSAELRCLNGEYHAFPNGSIYGPGPSGGEWNPLTSDADCWMLVDKLAVDDWDFTLERSYMFKFRSYAWYANFDDAATARDPDRRRAIVTACLRTVGAFKEQPPEEGGAR